MLITGEIEIFAGLFEAFVLNNLSYFDAARKEKEKVYHAFVLGILVSLSENYEVKSNKESGYAHIKKYDSTTKNLDVMIIPKDADKLWIIIEFKKINELLKINIDEGTEAALKQIEEMKYEQELVQRGVKNIIKLAAVFKGKEVRITQGYKSSQYL